MEANFYEKLNLAKNEEEKKILSKISSVLDDSIKKYIDDLEDKLADEKNRMLIIKNINNYSSSFFDNNRNFATTRPTSTTVILNQTSAEMLNLVYDF